MLEIIKSMLVGFIFGAICYWCNLPIPAPGVLAGVMGIVGVYAGFVVWSLL